MSNLFLVIGPSGSGKDYLVNRVCEKHGLKRVKSRTTRKPRYDGENSYKFKSNSSWLKEKQFSIAPVYYCNNYYWTLKEDLEEADFYIVEPTGIDTISKVDIECIVIYINIPVLRRIKHMIKRGDGFIQIIKRLINDRSDFREVRSKADYIVNDEEEFNNIVLNKS